MKIVQFKQQYLDMPRDEQEAAIEEMESKWADLKGTKTAWLVVQLIAWCQDNLKQST